MSGLLGKVSHTFGFGMGFSRKSRQPNSPLPTPSIVSAPLKISNPVISSPDLNVGSTATAVHGSYTGSISAYNGQWYRGATPIGGATALAYTFVSADIGLNVTYQELATNAAGSSSVGASNALGPVIGAAGTLAAPALGYPSPIAGNPTSIVVRLPVDWQSGVDALKLALSASSAMISPTILSHTINDTDIANGTATISIPTLAGQTYIQSYGNHSGVDSANRSNIVAWGDTTAPTITTSASQANTETFKLAIALTATDTGGVPALVSDGTSPGWYIDSGADQLKYEIAIVAGSPVLRWYGDGVQSYAAPTDQGADNTYIVTVGAIDYSGNKTTKTITSTVAAADLTPDAFSFTAVSGATRSTNYIAAETVTISGLGAGVNAPLTVSGGLSYSKNGGAYTTSAGTITNGDTLNVKETSSSSYLTAITGSVTVGTSSVNFVVTTMADPAAAAFTPSTNQPAPIGNSYGSAVYTFTGVDFVVGGFAVVFADYMNSDTRTFSSIVIQGAGASGADISLVARKTAATAVPMAVWACPDAAPIVNGTNRTVVVTMSTVSGNLGIMCGTLINAASSVPSVATEVDQASINSPVTAPAVTVPSAGVGVTFWQMNPTPPFTAVTGTLIGSYTNQFQTGSHGAITRQVVAGSWTPSISFTGGANPSAAIALAWNH